MDVVGAYRTFGAISLPVIAIWLFVHAIRLWTGYRNHHLHLSIDRSARLYELAQKGRWRRVPPLALQMAVAQAYHMVVDDRIIRFVLTHHDALSMLRDLRMTGRMLRLNPQGTALQAAGFKFRFSYRLHAIWAYAFGVVPYVVLALSAPCLHQWVAPMTAVILLAGALAWMVLAVWIASTFEAAHRLSEASDRYYPVC